MSIIQCRFRSKGTFSKRTRWPTLVGTLMMLVLLALGCQSKNPPPGSVTPTPAVLAAATIAETAEPAATSLSATTVPAATSCPPPPVGWVTTMIDAGDTLWDLAEQTGVDPVAIQQANCLSSDQLVVGQFLYLPVRPTPTPTPCVFKQPAGWGGYLVRPGDILRTLAIVRGITVEQAMAVNCLTTETVQPNQMLFLPAIILPELAPTEPAPPSIALAPLPELAPTEPAPPSIALAPLPELAPTEPASPSIALAPLPQPTRGPGAGTSLPLSGQSSTDRDSSSQPAPPSNETVKRNIAAPLEKVRAPAYLVGSPGLDFVPCKDSPTKNASGLWIGVSGLKEGQAVPGQHLYFYACGFEPSDRLYARVMGPNGYIIEPRVLALPQVANSPDLNIKQLDRNLLGTLYSYDPASTDPKAFGAVIWDTTCDLRPGQYTVMIRGQSGRFAQYSFPLAPAKADDPPMLLAAPQILRDASGMDVHFCAPITSARTVEIELDQEDLEATTNRNSRIRMSRIYTWTITLPPDETLWPVSSLNFDPQLRNGFYVLRATLNGKKLLEKLWLYR